MENVTPYFNRLSLLCRSLASEIVLKELRIIPYSAKVWRIHIFRAVGEKIWRNIGLAKSLLIVSINLNDFSLANHGRFAKLSRYVAHVFHIASYSYTITCAFIHVVCF